MKKLFLILLLSISTTFSAGVFDPDVDIKNLQEVEELDKIPFKEKIN